MVASVHVMAEPAGAGYVDKGTISERRDSVWTDGPGGDAATKVCSASFQQECEALQVRLKNHQKGVLDPDSAVVQRWDGLTFTLLIYTAIITPFEVGYLDVKTKDFLFWLNRFVDLVFFLDIFVQFRLAYRDETKGSMLIKSQRKIARRYATTWFPIDLVSVIPFDVLNLLVAGSALSKLKIIRLAAEMMGVPADRAREIHSVGLGG